MNLNLVIDTSQFKPFDYRMAWEAIDKYNSGYEKLQAVYDKIALTLGDLASAVEGSTKAKEIYDAYQQLFNNSASEFFNSGMNIRTARDLGNLRRLYGTQIRQLERANEAMVKEAERRRTAKPELNMLYQDIGNLDNWLENPNRILGSYSGTQLSTEVTAMMKAAASDMIKLDNAGLLNPYVKKWLKTKGFSSENVNKAIAEVLQGGIDNVKDNIMRGILQSAMQSSGIYNWADADTKRKAEIMASRGLYGGIGESEMGTYEDKAATTQLEVNKAIAIERAKAAEKLRSDLLKGLTDGTSTSTSGDSNLNGTIPINSKDIISPALEQKETLNTLSTSLNQLGITKKDGKYLYSKVEVPITPKKLLITPYLLHREFALYRKNGALMTRHQFISQGKDENEKKLLGSYYDNEVTSSLFNLGINLNSYISKGKVPRAGEIASKYGKAESNNGSVLASFIPIPMSKDDSNKILNNFVTEVQILGEDRLPAGTISEVEGWTKEGDLKLGLPASVGELQSEGTPLYYTHVGKKIIKNVNGKLLEDRTDLSKYLIFKKNGKTYAYPKSKLGTIVNDHYANGDRYQLLIENKDRIINLIAKLIIDNLLQYGANVDLSDEKVQNAIYQKAFLKWKESVDNEGSAYLRNFGTALGLEYNSPAFDFTSTSNSAKP